MASYDSTALLAVRSTATIGLGIATGVMLSYPLVSWPSMYSPTSPHDIKGRLDLFWNFYSHGADVMKAVLPSMSALLAYASLLKLAPERALCSRERFFGVQAVLAIAAASAIASVPLTFAVIMPVNMRLKAIKDAKAKGTGVEGKFFLLARPVADNPS
ncbi:hypothetical protein C6P46_001245 [Rhodotorula mucilaginosa]|uniref:Uncharacterized protein n=1 Tax=Rhodotorula mucilaginosa TaxID=5537 RepID=A0A9P6W781_RHOMI|nr:hypothetical protein C6P46_001245 [Rhodotorula mucilaginosa]